jgi:hypothetical protein
MRSGAELEQRRCTGAGRPLAIKGIIGPSYGVLGCWPGRLQLLEVAVALLGPMPGWMCCCRAWRDGRRAPGGRYLEPWCSQIDHRRCAYPWTSQHTYLASMQVRRTMVDAPVRRRTGWRGSNPGTLSALTPSADHGIDPICQLPVCCEPETA